MSRAPLLVIGDSLLDRDITGSSTRSCPDAPAAPVIEVESVVARPGGAALAALMSTADGIPTTLLTPLADDPEGHELCSRLEDAGVTVVPLRHHGGTRVKARLRSTDGSGASTIARMDTGGPGHPVGAVTGPLEKALDGAAGVLLSCYGGGVSHHREVRNSLSRWLRTGRPLVWDPHPRGAEPIRGCTLLTPNLPEAQDRTGLAHGTGAELARWLLREWSAGAVAVTAGADGAYLVEVTGAPDASLGALGLSASPRADGVVVQHVPCEQAADGDTCGAGDRFATAAAAALAAGRDALEATQAAVAAASGFVAGGGVAAVTATPAVVPRPPTVVATGGCFDILHAGHLQLLEEASQLGDRLVVLVNSDDSVRRLKGPSRPVHRLEDRVRMLRALACVDAVAVFHEDDPRAALERFRPDVWVKGGDYTVDELPETELVRSWGGRVVTLSTLPGRSTTSALLALNGGSR